MTKKRWITLKSIGIYVNENKDNGLCYTSLLCKEIKQNGMASSIIVNDNMVCNIDAIISVGGDGTILKASKIASKYGKPIVGINLGTVGFLTGIDKDKMALFIKRIANGQYFLQERSMLEMSILRDNEVIVKNEALNDVVLSKKEVSRAVKVNCYVNGGFQTNYLADGVIVATPSGSTAYSMSAGGPLVDVLANVLIITPVCSHSFSPSSYITTDDKTLEFTLDLEEGQKGRVTVDGQDYYDVEKSDIILVRKSQRVTTLINFDEVNYFRLLKDKLGR